MEIRAYDPADVERVAGFLRAWITAEAVKYLERDYDDGEYTVSPVQGHPNGLYPGLHRTVWWTKDRYNSHLIVQPMFTLKSDEDEDEDIYTCNWCRTGARHRCFGCGRFQAHMVEDDCPNCWDAALSKIAKRPPEEDPQEW